MANPGLNRPIAGLLVLLMAGCTSTTTLRTYGPAGVQPLPGGNDPAKALELYVSRLEGITPYRHAYPSGLVVEAPGMDPRRYLLPDSLRFSRHFLAGRSAHLGEPERAYLALGEVLVDLDDAGCSMGSYSVRTGAELLRLREERAAARPRADAEYTRSVGDEPFDLPLGHMAGNGTPFLNLHPLNWEHALKKVETSCRALGADALIECFVGRGQFVDWTPAGRLSAPLFMPGGRALALGGRETPANASPSGWQFIGLAVRWADPGESSAGARETSDSLPADRQAGEHPGQPERGRPR